MTGRTVGSVWAELSGRTIDDDLLDWVPDVFALTDTLLARSEAYRFAVSPPSGTDGWPPPGEPAWRDAVLDAAEQWCLWVADPAGSLPPLVADGWAELRRGTDTTIEDLGDGKAWALATALLTLHAASDEACAGMGVVVPNACARGFVHRARARELFARTGSLARIPRERLRVLPKVRTPPGGISFRSLSRYVCVRDAGVDVDWHRAPVRRPGTAQQHGNLLLLPWPLRIRERDFTPVPGSVQRTENEPFGFFTFEPAEPFDTGLLDRVLAAARDEVETIDVVVLPESAVPEGAIDELETVLQRHGVSVVIAGVREAVGEHGELPANWVHLGVLLGGRWWHYRQNKHHRWFLDSSQIEQYHLGGALHPGVRWWEAMSVPRRSMQLVELGNGITFVAVICEDLARMDEVADLLRAVGPTLVVTLLLDGPQLASRWTSRYASVLADDPGSAVLTLTASGFVQRSRPHGRQPTPIVALWKDATRGLHEISLDGGSHGVVVTVAVDQARRRAADGRMPVDNVADLFVAGVQQIRADDATAPSGPTLSVASTIDLDVAELTVLSGWAGAVAEAIADVPADLESVLTDMRAGAPWRADLGLQGPGASLQAALAGLAQLGQDACAIAGTSAQLAVLHDAAGAANELTALLGTLLAGALETQLSG